MSRWIRLGVLGVVSIIGISLSSAVLAEVTGTLRVSAQSVAICNVSIADLNFGDYRGTAVTTSGAIEVNCTQDVPYTIGLGGGNNPVAGSSGMRQLGNFRGDMMAYQLYLDAGLTQEWGDECVSASTFAGFPCKQLYNGDGDGITGEAIAGTGAIEAHTVYGEIPGDLIIPMGNYYDNVVITFVF